MLKNKKSESINWQGLLGASPVLEILKSHKIHFFNSNVPLPKTDGTALPGYRKKSFAMAFGGGEIWFEHLDGMYGYTELAIQKLEQDWFVWKRPSSPGLLAVNLDETKLENSLLAAITSKLLNPEKRLVRVVFVGVSRANVQKLKKALCDATFSLGFENDFEKAKQWLVDAKN